MKILRPFRDEDLDRVRELYEHASPATVGSGPWEDDLGAIRDVYVAPGGCFFVVEEDRRMVAMGALRKHGSREAEIKRMRVDPSSQRRGFGQMVLDALLQHAVNAKMSRIFLDTDENWFAARRFYEKNGFVEYQRKPWHGVALILYERNLVERRV